MAAVTVVKTIGSTGTFSTLQLWEDGAPANLTTAEKSAATTFLVAAFVQGESLTFVGSGATGKFLDTDSTGAGTGTYVTYGITAGNPAASDVVTGGTSGATCVLTSGTATNVGVIWQGQCQNQEFSGTGNMITVSGSTVSSSAYKELTTLSGASFRDNANVQTNELRYNSSNGCGITSSIDSGNVVSIGETYSKISNIQINATGPSGRCLNFTGGGLIENMIMQGSNVADGFRATVAMSGSSGTGTAINCLIINRGSGNVSSAIISIGAGDTALYNCTIVSCDDIAAAPVWMLEASSGTKTVQNCSLFSGDSSTTLALGGGATINFITCYSDISGTTGVTQTTYGDEFQSVNDATRDFRLKSGSVQANAGTTDATNAPTDIVGTPRGWPNGAAYDVGCWEIKQGADPAVLRQISSNLLW